MSAPNSPSTTPLRTPPHNPRIAKCAHCGIPTTKVCSRCHLLFACSRECQTLTWPLHKTKCPYLILSDSDESTGIKTGNPHPPPLEAELTKRDARITVFHQDLIKWLWRRHGLPEDAELPLRNEGGVLSVEETVELYADALEIWDATNPAYRGAARVWCKG
ncbi:hypothetical protein HK097_007852 [Rhizophlyctis rosea]|uniref:MYND-type domain-containing protein n=1 Tax=Rhizophlyctis rosea TaxID=64517 RepID=A0AAD5SB40_9FUNG|nr:hypothetical protein HK097_007852 [Rhizophlyctis rosea]